MRPNGWQMVAGQDETFEIEKAIEYDHHIRNAVASSRLPRS
ncbi:hypothetical protein KOR42_25270 [Thalassoglobus neptunius]|uniref:Uncharacterized protein n=1 Tax=Thalassoglobus neptunius TaxID=1938619 RepID=A0A5C5X8H1_9PLAN|nr:hypothetical protein KOR42_25270 [Thalassoglobus neptunius]